MSEPDPTLHAKLQRFGPCRRFTTLMRRPLSSSAPFGEPAFLLLSFGSEVGGHPHFAAILLQGRKSANIHASSGVILGIPKGTYRASDSMLG
jgi:hypothetical protein